MLRGDMARVPLRLIIRVFAWTGLTALGGGRSAYFYDSVVVRRSWVKTGEFVQDLTLSQLLPGPNFANLAMALGSRLGGWRGGVGGLLAVLVPGALVLLGLTALYFRGGFAPGTTRLMHGMGATVVGLVLVTTAQLVTASIRGHIATAVAVATFLLAGPLGVNSALAVCLVLPVSLWVNRPRSG
jgi:chromate transporter